PFWGLIRSSFKPVLTTFDISCSLQNPNKMKGTHTCVTCTFLASGKSCLLLLGQRPLNGVHDAASDKTVRLFYDLLHFFEQVGIPCPVLQHDLLVHIQQHSLQRVDGQHEVIQPSQAEHHVGNEVDGRNEVRDCNPGHDFCFLWNAAIPRQANEQDEQIREQ